MFRFDPIQSSKPYALKRCSKSLRSDNFTYLCKVFWHEYTRVGPTSRHCCLHVIFYASSNLYVSLTLTLQFIKNLINVLHSPRQPYIQQKKSGFDYASKHLRVVASHICPRSQSHNDSMWRAGLDFVHTSHNTTEYINQAFNRLKSSTLTINILYTYILKLILN